MSANDTVLITGASSGIGVEFAKQLAPQSKRIVLTARRRDRLEELASQLREKHKELDVLVVEADLAQTAGVEALMQAVEDKQWPVDLLINNAGFGLHGLFHEESLETYLSMLDLNIRALVRLTHHFVRQMVERKRGGVINIASTAAFQPVPWFAVYAASKSFVLHFSEALDREVRPHGVRVLAECPGPTRTEFVEVSHFDNSPLSQRVPWWTPEAIAREALKAFRKKKPVRISGFFNRLAPWLSRFFPRRAVTWIALLIFRRKAPPALPPQK